MDRSVKYLCTVCGREHEEWPAIAWDSPTHYNELSEADKELAQLSSDFCVIHNDDQADRFIRCTLHQKVKNHCESLDYGIWVSLSESSFNDYSAHFSDDVHVTTYFGWLCSNIAGYDSTLSIPTDVKTRPGGQRPEVVPHRDFDHPFVRDYYEGISIGMAQDRIREMLDIVAKREGNDETA